MIATKPSSTNIAYTKGLVTRSTNSLKEILDKAKIDVTIHKTNPASQVQKFEEYGIQLGNRKKELESRFSALLNLLGEPEEGSEEEKKLDDTIKKVIEMIDETNKMMENLELSIRRGKEESTRDMEGSSTPRNNSLVADSTPSTEHRLELPKLQKFRGKHWEFEAFWAVYQETVEKSNQSNILKMTHLLNSLDGPPKELLQQFAISDGNYQKAVAKLLEKYQNKEKVTAELTQMLQSAEATGTSTMEQRRLLDKLAIITSQLIDAKENIDSTIIKNMIIRKFSTHVQEEIFKRKMQMNLKDWTVEKIMEDITSIISREEELNDLMGRTDRKPDSTKDTKIDSDSRTSFGSYGKKESKYSKDEPKTWSRKYCQYCNTTTHYSSECTQFETFESRIKELVRQEKCAQCHGKGHKTQDCKGYICKCNVAGHHMRNCPNQSATVATIYSLRRSQEKYTKQRTLGMTQKDTKHSKKKNERTIAVIPTFEATGFNHASQHFEQVSIIIDTGSDQTYISSDLAEKWNLPIIGKEQFFLKTFAKEEPKKTSCKKTRISLQANDGETMNIDGFISTQLVGQIRKAELSRSDLKYALKQGIKINKDSLKHTVTPKIIVGCDVIPLICSGEQRTLPSGLNLLNTKFGSTTFGKINNSSSGIPTPSTRSLNNHQQNSQQISKQIPQNFANVFHNVSIPDSTIMATPTQKAHDSILLARKEELRNSIASFLTIVNREKQLMEDVKYNTFKRMEIVKVQNNEVPDYAEKMNALNELITAIYSNLGFHESNLREYQELKKHCQKMINLGVFKKERFEKKKDEAINEEELIKWFEDVRSELDTTMSLVTQDRNLNWQCYQKQTKEAAQDIVKAPGGSLHESKRTEDVTGGTCKVEVTKKRRKQTSSESSTDSDSVSGTNLKSAPSEDESPKKGNLEKKKVRTEARPVRILTDGRPDGSRYGCIFCGKTHWSDSCPKFSTVEKRRNILQENGKCFKCLGDTLRGRHNCKERSCLYCHSKEHDRSICPKPMTVEPKNQTNDRFQTSPRHAHSRPAHSRHKHFGRQHSRHC